MRTLAHPRLDEVSVDAVLAALADPIRRRIVVQLSRSEAAQACGAFDLPVAKSTSTHHFRVLREAGVITQHYDGNRILNALRTADMEDRFPGLMGAIVAAEQRAPAAVEPPCSGPGAHAGRRSGALASPGERGEAGQR
ncbi:MULTISPECIES: ArsR/SmtB family transcription factor [Streptomyces]|uniref:ArsR/SmtB family transcription factor n=1 Tax=Streptomyces TaxID=1883 RepID=UPI00340BD24A